MDLSVIATHFDDIAKIIGGFLAASGVIWSVWKWIFPAIKSIQRSFVQMEKIASISDAILHEFRPNGGGSMKDTINRIEINLQGVRADAMRMEARQWAIVAALPDPVFETNALGECLRVNSAYLHLVGRAMHEIMGNGWEIVIHPEDRARIWKEWTDAVTRKRSFESAYRIVDSEGTVYDVRAISHPYKNPFDDEVLGYLGRFVSVKKA